MYTIRLEGSVREKLDKVQQMIHILGGAWMETQVQDTAGLEQ